VTSRHHPLFWQPGLLPCRQRMENDEHWRTKAQVLLAWLS